MARQVRLEYEGAIYHVMARGDRREVIVRDDEDRKTFLRTLGEACARSGFRVHAYVLMSNHYHLLLETPEANLTRGMGWLQNAFTRRINTRHGLWGHVFGGRYKAIPVEPGECFLSVMDYIHLNPVRAGMIDDGEGLESYPWSSLKHYVAAGRSRPEWLQTREGFLVCGCEDDSRGRRSYLEALERRVGWINFLNAGEDRLDGRGKPQLAVHSALRRGWFVGSQEFREKLLKLGAETLRARSRKKDNGHHGEALRDHGEKRARALLAAGLKYFDVDLEELKGARKNDLRKGLLAEMIQAKTAVRLDWISAQLGMGTRSGCCRLIYQMREKIQEDRQLKKQRKKIKKLLSSGAL